MGLSVISKLGESVSCSKRGWTREPWPELPDESRRKTSAALPARTKEKSDKALQTACRERNMRAGRDERGSRRATDTSLNPGAPRFYTSKTIMEASNIRMDIAISAFLDLTVDALRSTEKRAADGLQYEKTQFFPRYDV